MKRKANKPDEQDVVVWRRVLLWRPGEVSKIKRRMRRRERHDVRHELERERQ